MHKTYRHSTEKQPTYLLLLSRNQVAYVNHFTNTFSTLIHAWGNEITTFVCLWCKHLQIKQLLFKYNHNNIYIQLFLAAHTLKWISITRIAWQAFPIILRLRRQHKLCSSKSVKKCMRIGGIGVVVIERYRLEYTYIWDKSV